MSYQKKYYFTFVSAVDETHVVELWQNTAATITAQEINGLATPFLVSLPDIGSIFKVVRGTGCTINILSETDMQFLDGLYFVDPKEYMVKHYINGAINWLGYLNSEMYREPYSFSENYRVSVTGNNGLSLMDRLTFLQSDGSNYSGIKSQFEILQIVCDKIGLPWAFYFISLSTTFTGFSASTGSTILHETYVDCANFYDEDNTGMTLRGVLESILTPYEAIFIIDKDVIKITDVNTAAQSSSITYQEFDFVSGAYIADIIEVNEKAISDIGYMGTGQSIEISGGVNKQVIAYSPYPSKSIIKNGLTREDEFASFSAWAVLNGYNFRWCYTNKYFLEAAGNFLESYYTDATKKDIYLEYGVVTTNAKVMSLLSPPPVAIVERGTVLITAIADSPAFKIEFEILVKTKLNPYDENEVGVDYQAIEFSRKIKVGGKYYDGIHGWTMTDYGGTFYVDDNGNSITDRFVKASFIIPIQSLTGNDEILEGDFDFEIWSDIWAYKDYGSSVNTKNPSDIREIWIKNVSISVTKGDKSNIPDNDIEYVGNLNKLFKEEGKKVTLTCGTNVYDADRGKLMYNNSGYLAIDNWTRQGQTFKVEELLLNSYASNLKAGKMKLTAMKLAASFSLQNILTDSFLPGKKLMVTSSKINYIENVNECELKEISKDVLTIVNG